MAAPLACMHAGIPPHALLAYCDGMRRAGFIDATIARLLPKSFTWLMAPPSAVGTADPSTFVETARPVPLTRGAAGSDNILFGIGLIVASTLCFSAGDVAAKVLTATTSALEVTWYRYVVFALLFIPMSAMANRGRAFTTTRPWLQFFRAIGVVASSVFFIMGLQYLQPAECTAINFVSPLFITLLSIPLLGERVGVHRMIATIVGFIGVLIVVQPGSSAFQVAALYPIINAVAWAGAMIATRLMIGEKPEVTLAWAGLVGAVGLGVIMPFVWRTPDATELLFAVLTGVFSCGGHWFIVRAYRYAPASLLAPFSYVQIIFAGALGYFAFGLVPGPATFAGGVVIAASGLYTAQRERAQRAAA